VRQLLLTILCTPVCCAQHDELICAVVGTGTVAEESGEGAGGGGAAEGRGGDGSGGDNNSGCGNDGGNDSGCGGVAEEGRRLCYEYCIRQTKQTLPVSYHIVVRVISFSQFHAQ
jgi:hypothetical protein